ncbi:HU family DNA-binding protein, partial [Bacteroides sp.]
MPLFYRAIQSPIADKNGVKKWHLSLVKVGKTVNTKQLADVIAEKSSLTVGDVQNVVTNLMVVMRRELLNSRTVRLEGLGTFTMRVRSNGKGVETAEK